MNRPQQRADERSLLIIKSGSVDMVAAVFAFASEWCDGRGMKAAVRNTPDGCYELYEVKPNGESKEHRE